MVDTPLCIPGVEVKGGDKVEGLGMTRLVNFSVISFNLVYQIVLVCI